MHAVCEALNKLEPEVLALTPSELARHLAHFTRRDEEDAKAARKNKGRQVARRGLTKSR